MTREDRNKYVRVGVGVTTLIVVIRYGKIDLDGHVMRGEKIRNR